MFYLDLEKWHLLTLVCSLLDTANTIACDLTPRIATGFKLHSTQTLRFCIPTRKFTQVTERCQWYPFICLPDP